MSILARIPLAGFLLLPLAASAQSKPSVQSTIFGTWTGTAISHGQQVPLELHLSGSPQSPTATLINGPEITPASSATFSGHHLLITFNDFARTIDATLRPDHKLSGSFGTTKSRYPLTLTQGNPPGPISASTPPDIHGEWEIAVDTPNGESAWQLRVDQDQAHVRAVIQRVDGDTASLYGTWDQPAPGQTAPSHTFRVSRFSAASPALYTLTPQPDGTLLVSNLLRADQTTNRQQNLVARRPAAARAAHLAPPTDPTQQTRMKDPDARLQFSAPDLSGHIVSNTDRQFDGKVVIVTVGGSWCPNCHDEAPLLESLYQQFHPRGLEIVNLSFEDDPDQLKNPERLRTFIARYHIGYTVLLAGTTDQLNEKLPQAEHLDSWPTSFFIGRDGRVRQIHAGFAGPANPPAHAALVQEMTDLVAELIAEPVPTQSAATHP
jgi:thiol-disulfide isomerase/thioredoxin